MIVVYHLAVQRDVNGILRRYEGISAPLADEFWAELTAAIQKVAQNPERSHFDPSGLRRVNLRQFPYHFLFRVFPDRIRITVVRHNQRHPSFGLRRK